LVAMRGARCGKSNGRVAVLTRVTLASVALLLLCAHRLKLNGRMPPRNPALPAVNERVVLQRLLAGTWKSVAELDQPSPRLLSKLQSKEWIVRRGAFAQFRITELGEEALRAKLP
jgi:hypothetical protein